MKTIQVLDLIIVSQDHLFNDVAVGEYLDQLFNLSQKINIAAMYNIYR